MQISPPANGTLARVWSVFETPIAGSPFTLAKLIVASVLLVALVWVTGRLTRWLARGVLRRRGVDAGISEEIATLLRYLLTSIGVVLILQAVVGVNLNAIVGLLAGLGVGLGFGLQNIISNFFSGLIILFERPIKVGEKVRVGEAVGTVRRIAIRATTIVADDNTAIIITNSDFISQRVTNWRYAARSGRVEARVRAPLTQDPARVLERLRQAAQAMPWANETPVPEALLLDMADGWAHFALRVWTRGTDASDALVSELNLAAWQALRPPESQAAAPAAPAQP
jgi:small-conductance mechanosensitive channel